jgi:hypothetical protein
VEGTVEADDLYHTAGTKGQAKQGGKKGLGRRARGRRKKRGNCTIGADSHGFIFF